MTRTAWLSLEAELEIYADTISQRALEYRQKSCVFVESRTYWQGRAEQCELDAKAIRKAIEERRPEPGDFDD